MRPVPPVRTMKSYICVIFLVVILPNVIRICDGSCYTECYDELPRRIQWWKSKSYGLEIEGEKTTSTELEGEDAITQKEVNSIGRAHMKIQIDRMIRNNKGKKLPDFTIVKLDPISYKYQKQNMLITFSNVKMYNLDGYAYDDKAAQFTQTGMYEYGNYVLYSETYNDIKKKLEQTEDKNLRAFFNRIEATTTPDKYNLRRRDCKWTIAIKANFVTKQSNKDKPIIIETNFKIQPDKEKNWQDFGMRAKGTVKMEFHDFRFEISLDVTHIDDPLRPYLHPDIQSDNLTPDFNVVYSLNAIMVKDIELFPYDGDDIVKDIDDVEEVNDKLPTKEKLEEIKKEEKKKGKMPKKSLLNEKEIPINDENLKESVASHLEVLSDLIKNQRGEIKKKLCRNLLPKMAWKLMHMDTKKQLPSLFYQIIAYEDDFMERVKLPKFTVWDTFNLGWDVAGAKLGNMASSFGSYLGKLRSNSAPPRLESTEIKEDEKNKQ